MRHFNVVSKCGDGEESKVGNAGFGGKSSFISAITFFLDEDNLEFV